MPRRMPHVLAGQEPASSPLDALLDGVEPVAQGSDVDLGGGSTRPISGERRTAARAPPVAIMAFDGMQSHRWAAPPMMSLSIRVTSAPSRAAWDAAVLPAGPPPMITKRFGTGRGYRE